MSSVTLVDPAKDPVWQQLTMSHRSDVFHSPAWLTVLADTYGFTPMGLVVDGDSERPTAGLPFIDIDDRRGPRRVALPFSDSCDAIGEPGAWPALSDAFLNFDGPVRMRVVHDHAPIDDSLLNVTSTAAWHSLALAGTAPEIWDGIDAVARRAVRRATKTGLEARATTDEHHLRAFYDLHLATRKYKYRLLPQPYGFFENIRKRFFDSGTGHLMAAFDGETMVAGILFLEWQNRWYYKFNASDPEYLSHRPNDLCLWRGIESAVAASIDAIDFGLSDLDQPGLLRYKAKYASEDKTIFSLATSETADTAVVPFQDALREITSLMTADDIPDRLTEAAGAQFYRYFA